MKKLLIPRLFFLFIVVPLFSLNPSVAQALERFDLVTTEEMQEMLRQREEGAVDFLLVNCLDEMIFRDSHIPGSINIPLTRHEQFNDRLGEDKNKLIITY